MSRNKFPPEYGPLFLVPLLPRKSGLHPPNANFHSNFQRNFPVDQIVQEYYKLSKIQNPSEAELAKLTAILELSQYDEELSGLICQMDNLIAEELELSSTPPQRTSQSNMCCTRQPTTEQSIAIASYSKQFVFLTN